MGIGVVSTPLVQTPSIDADIKSVVVNVVLSIPAGKTVTVAPYQDIPSPNVVSVANEAITVDEASIAYTDYEGFRLLSFNAAVVVPDVAILRGRNPEFIGVQVRYGLEVSTDDDVEYVVGNFLVYPEGATELGWQNPTINLDLPTDGAEVAADTEIDIEASYTEQNDEKVKFGWFATDGEIGNRRSLKTKWKTPAGAGTYQLIITARGKKSRGFSYRVITVTVK